MPSGSRSYKLPSNSLLNLYNLSVRRSSEFKVTTLVALSTNYGRLKLLSQFIQPQFNVTHNLFSINDSVINCVLYNEPTRVYSISDKFLVSAFCYRGKCFLWDYRPHTEWSTFYTLKGTERCRRLLLSVFYKVTLEFFWHCATSKKYFIKGSFFYSRRFSLEKSRL